jgi:hypothetical protein
MRIGVFIDRINGDTAPMLHVGDVITSINGVKIESCNLEEIQGILENCAKPTPVTIVRPVHPVFCLNACISDPRKLPWLLRFIHDLFDTDTASETQVCSNNQATHYSKQANIKNFSVDLYLYVDGYERTVGSMSLRCGCIQDASTEEILI